jgi:hypothetical protein
MKYSTVVPVLSCKPIVIDMLYRLSDCRSIEEHRLNVAIAASQPSVGDFLANRVGQKEIHHS